MIGTRLGPYEITAKLGEGGMGVVFQAKDSQLGREVALKVLPEGLTDDAERLARFEREARLLASLNHPNIAQVYGLETSGDTRALIMELVEGPTLADRLNSGALRLDESLSIARQIAEALEEAHDKGIIHRDLKPQNIKASIEGKVKVLDFGLAKAMEPAGEVSASELAHSPTLTFGGTREGVILGTAAYMAPEQARGGAVDKRADIWAFGVVLYEMLAGERLFAEGSVVDTLSAVMRKPIDLDRLPATTPPRLRRLVHRCLERQPKNRLRDIGDARIVLDELLADPAAQEPAPWGAPGDGARSQRSLTAGAVGAVAGLVVGAVAAAWLTGALAGSRGPRHEPGLVSLVSSGSNAWPAFSPDGKTVAFTSERGGANRIWILDLRSGVASPVSDHGASSPRFSPDGGSLLYSLSGGADNSADLYSLHLVGGAARRMVSGAYDGDWSPDGKWLAYVRAPSDQSTEFRVGVMPVAGGSERAFPGSANQLISPRWSPDGHTIAVSQLGPSTGVPDQILLYDTQSAAVRSFGVIRSDGVPLRVVGLAWLDRKSLILLAGDLEAAAFRTSSGRIVRLDVASGSVQTLLALPDVWRGVDVAADGRIVVATGTVAQNLAVEPFPPEPGMETTWLTEGSFSDRQPAWSPDGKSILFSSDRSGNLDLWRVSVHGRELTQITFDPSDDWDPAWSPDGARILSSSNRSGKFQIWMAEADGSAPRQVTLDENAQNPTMTADGAWIVYNSFDPDPARRGLWKIHPDGTGAAHLVPGLPNVPDLSRDGSYVAFRGETMRMETRIARVADGTLLEFALRGVTRLRWRPARVPTLGLLHNEDDATRLGMRRFVGRLGLAEIGTGDSVGSPRWFEPTTASGGAETFDFSPDGKQVVFSTVRGVSSRIFLVEGLIDGQGP